MTEPVQYAGFWRRFAATMIDVVLILAIVLTIVLLLFDLPLQPATLAEPLPGEWLFHLALSILEIFLWVRFGATPGKQLLRCKVVDARTGQYLSVGQALIRYFAIIVSIVPLGLGFLWIAWDPRKQSFHDKLAGSVVVLVQPEDLSEKSVEELMGETR